MTVEVESAHILYSIESVIVAHSRRTPELLDKDVLAAVEALIREYEREKRNRQGIMLVPQGRARTVFDLCLQICEWKLGRRSLNGSGVSPDQPREGDVSVPEMLRCLKRLRKSIRLWHKQGGRQGYLAYVRDFVAGAG